MSIQKIIFCLEKRKLKNIADILDASPIRFQLNKKKNDIGTLSKNYLLKKFHEAATLLKQTYVEAKEPGKTDEFISQVLNSSNQNSN